MASAAPRVTAASRSLSLTGSQRLVAFATALGLGGAALWLGPLMHATRPGSPVSIPWWAELAACYAARLASIELDGRRRVTLSLVELPLALGLFLVDPWALLGCYTVGVLLGHWTRRGLQPARDYGSLMLDIAFVAVAVLVFAAVRPDPSDPLALRSVLALLAAMAAAGGVLGPAVVVASIALYQGGVRASVALREFVSQIAGTVMSTSLAVVALTFATTRPLLALALLPAALLGAALQRAALDDRRRADGAQFLRRAGETIHASAPIDDRVGALLSLISDAFGAARVELLLMASDRRPALRFIRRRDERQVFGSRTELSADELAALHLVPGGAVATGDADHQASPVSPLASERGLRSCSVVALRGSQQVQGLLLLAPALRARRRDGAQLLEAASLIATAVERGQLDGYNRRRAAVDSASEHNGEPAVAIGDRAQFVETVANALGRVASTRRPLALLVMELGGLSSIAETFGSPMCETVLDTIAVRLRKHLRRHDVVARLGEDQLGLLLDGLRHRGDAEIVTRRLLGSVHRAIGLGGPAVSIVGSAGVALVDDYENAPSVDELMRRADMAMYLAKRQPSVRCVVFDNASKDSLIVTGPALPK